MKLKTMRGQTSSQSFKHARSIVFNHSTALLSFLLLLLSFSSFSRNMMLRLCLCLLLRSFCSSRQLPTEYNLQVQITDLIQCLLEWMKTFQHQSVRELQTRPNRQSHAQDLLAWHQPQKQMIQFFHLLDIKWLICLVLYALPHRKPTNRAIQIAHHHIVGDLQYQLCINMPILNKISRLHEILAVNDQCNLNVSHVQENTLSGDLIKSSCAACMNSSQLLMYTILPEFLESKEKLCAIHVRISDYFLLCFFLCLLALALPSSLAVASRSSRHGLYYHVHKPDDIR